MTNARPDLELVDFEATDQQAVRELVLDGLAEHWGELDPSLNADLDDIATSFGAGRTVVLRRARGVIATGSVIPRDSTTAEIVRMSVHRDHRHQGIGRVVVDELLDTARRWGARSVILETSSVWDDVVRFYLSCGFRLTGRSEGTSGEDTWFEVML